MAAYDMNPAQTITGCGELREIVIKMRKVGSPRFSIRAKIYLDVPGNLETGFPLDNYLGQSDNVVTAASITASYEDYTFTFDDLEVTGKWTVVFEYESVVAHGDFDYVVFMLAFLPPEGYYADGEFIYYDYSSDTWMWLPEADMAFLAYYCGEECPTTTTTTYSREPL